MRWWLAGLVLLAAGLFLAEQLYERGHLRFNYPSEARFPLRGIDVSHHQAEVDWQALAGAGVDFAFIKATEGSDFRDTRFQENWKAAGEAGISRGPYHFFTFCSPGESQAAHFLANVGLLPRELPAGVDVEFSGNCRSWTSIEAIREELASFLARVEEGLGDRPVIYVTPESHRRIKRGHFGGYDLWVRGLFFEPRGTEWSDWLFWQYADNARLPGIRGPVDLNVFCCAPERFEALRGDRAAEAIPKRSGRRESPAARSTDPPGSVGD